MTTPPHVAPPPRLNPNQISHRVGSIMKIIMPHHVDDQRTMLAQAGAHLQEQVDAIQPLSPADIAKKTISAIGEGLDRSNPAMVAQAMSWSTEMAGRDYLSSLSLYITPYTVADTSLEKVVLEAEPEIVALVEGALKQRRALDAARSGK